MIQQLTPPISGADQLAEVRRLYGQGLYLRAFSKAEAIAPLCDWTGPERRIMAGRLAGVLGGDRLARALHLVALRESPADPTVCYFGVRAVMSRWGPWFARRLWNRIGPLPDAPRDLRADWLAHYALISATLRDFEVADHFLAEALALAPSGRGFTSSARPSYRSKTASTKPSRPPSARWPFALGIGRAFRRPLTICVAKAAIARRSSCCRRPTSDWNAETSWRNGPRSSVNWG